jgi:uncharacterized protein YodC (DUF2158 family)
MAKRKAEEVVFRNATSRTRCSCEIVVGSTVWLKSGGPEMTVSASYENTADTLWFSGGTLNEGTFPMECLVTYNTNPGPG